MGGLHGDWALILLVYAALLAVAIAAHAVWVRRILRDVWRSRHHASYKMALTALLVMTPLVGFYAIRIIGNLRTSFDGRRLSMRDLVMPATGASTVLACAVVQTMRYSPDLRTWQAMLGFIPGYLAFYSVMQLILYMAASVFGPSPRGFLLSRTHLVSASILLVAGVFIR